MNKYIATFYSHFGALTYFKELQKQGIIAKLMPVPRKLSSSCGTCVFYECACEVDSDDCELDSVYEEKDCKFVCVLVK
ncbi:MAG: DUF3343 domain-containing protein [Oscillospiraceae bacterium]|nr:DUF3343 domain-containing protein [Oscillospiraceae bacterium]